MDTTAIIKSVMADKNITKNNIKERSSRQGVRGFSRIACSKPDCEGTWNTHQAHAVIDLKRQKVVRIYNQKCKTCQHENAPSFEDSVFREMVEKALEQEKKYRNNNRSVKRRSSYRDDDDEYGGPPHESSLCEKCGYGSSPCWKRTRRY
ncbi:uncharacterized protein LOC105444717 [Strongylocentrotus purpuratus]|uniref:3CxxC-type domain-containing protein n=1 Tax=Strongylocentrotus purpuratus TaxID=7668 RepID=A0A7M7T5T2_STRPU|nr:uncharacterized protein LOC105444717 [Strongylocentrotus purpuratus]XP_011677643.1 uncharacterized protein LOC105444717 [Strongylocentrotus purpuratus]XP_030856026.1 uncharacterized protein LOC105444717 [Strongylocentrotus purpuratus]|eukprot:XP_011677642.1 PREDICTED: uncharacterized protein LOC105444717 [Strongylocentrotus purpuratus]